MSRAILILGASLDQLFMIESAHEMGLQTVVIDGNAKAPGLAKATWSKDIDFSHIVEVIAYVDELIDDGVNLQGVATMGSDVPHLLAAISSYYGWPGPSVKTAAIATDKFLMKECFSEMGIAVPHYAEIKQQNEINTCWQQWGCSAVVIKPVSEAGSRGVRVIHEVEQIEPAYLAARSQSRNNRVILEEYIDGPQISTETIVYRDQYFHPGFADRVYEYQGNFFPNIMENGGWQPSQLSSKKREAICELIELAAQAIGIHDGVMKGDCVWSEKYDKPMIIEVAARLSGGDFSASLVPLAHDVNYVKTVLALSLGDEPDLKALKPTREKVAANRYFFLPEGTLQAIEGLDDALLIPSVKKIEINYALGEQVVPLEHHGQRVGVFVVCDDDAHAVQAVIDHVYQILKFTVNGKVLSGDPRFYGG
ncbi:MAG: ATP-grasp domain-containing protein [Methylococcales bacterium]|nr:ATP-grasp domain-containing protein [Methylococcales bacterium]MBT7443497.1 ATP-grasp domain-containing protein [Methylococcales bacterium]